MISGVNNNFSVNRQMQPPPQPMTDDQKESLNSIISNYDASNISDSDFQNMMNEIKNAGIAPSRELRSTLEEAGFEMPEGQGPHGPNGPGAQEPPAFMKDLMQKIQNGEITEDDITAFLGNFSSGESTTGAITDAYA